SSSVSSVNVSSCARNTHPRGQPGLPHAGAHTVILRTLRGGRPRLAVLQRGLGRSLDLVRDTLLDLAEAILRDTLPHEVLLVQSNRIATPPVLEQRARERRACFRLVVRRVPPHTERLDHQQRRTTAVTCVIR